MAEGDTILEGAAKEPEITALCRYLQCCGAHIEGVGTGRLMIRGGRRLYGTDFTVPADRIVAGTYLLACIGTGGSVFLENAPEKDMESVLETAERMGAKLCVSGEGIYVQASVPPKSLGCLRTAPHPGFPTDLQSVALAVETVGDGFSVIEETIFENRFRVVEDLRRMGACIEMRDKKSVLVKGMPALKGAAVQARELRGGAALVAAGLIARGETLVTGCSFIYRGYENICRDFRELGARVVSV